MFKLLIVVMLLIVVALIGGAYLHFDPSWSMFSPRWVLGFEADFQGSSERGSGSFVDPFATPACNSALTLRGGAAAICISYGSLQGASLTGYDAEKKWFGTVRARLGFLLTDQILLLWDRRLGLR